MEFTIRITASGTDGSASGTGRTELPIRGRIEAVAVAYTFAPATTVVSVTENGGANRTILTTPASATDSVYYPRAGVVSTTGIPIPYVAVPMFIANHSLNVSVSGTNDGSVINLTLIVSDTIVER